MFTICSFNSPDLDGRFRLDILKAEMIHVARKER